MGRLGKLRSKLADKLRPQSPPTSSVAPEPATATPSPTSAATPSPTSAATPSPTSAATPSPTSAATPTASTSPHPPSSITTAASAAPTSTTAAASPIPAALAPSTSATPPTSSENAAAAVAPTNPTACSSPSAAHPSPTPTHPLFPVMGFVENPSSPKPSTPRPVYVSLSSDLRLINLKPNASAPSSLLDFRSQHFQMHLKRLPDAPSPDPPLSTAAHLEAVVQPRAGAETHDARPAVRVSDGSGRTVILVAGTEKERDAFLLALRLRIAPWPLLVAHMKDEIVAARAPTATSPSLADAVREFYAGKAGETGVVDEKMSVGVANTVWEMAGTVAETSIWSATFAQGIGSVAETAEEVAKPLGGLTVVGCAFSLVALSAKAVKLISLEKAGRTRLGKAEDDLHKASLSVVGWLFSVLGSRFRDEDGLVNNVFHVLGKCWMVAQELEQYLLARRVSRVWSAESVPHIVQQVESLKDLLLGVGLLKTVAQLQLNQAGLHHQVQEHDKVINDWKVSVFDDFRLPAQAQTELGVELVPGAATCLGRLKTAILSSKSKNVLTSKERVHEVSSERDSLRLPRVALTSISGEGGVGKTSTCRLLCRDSVVRNHFSGGAVVWIDVGKSATEEKVKREIQRNVSKFGGKRSAEEVSSADSVLAAVEIAREFFKENCILVVIDNVWETPVGFIVTNWISVLAQIACHSGSAVIATTRSSTLARGFGFNQLQLGRLDLTSDSSPDSDWHVAEDLYDTLLNAPVETQSTVLYKKTRKQALVLSCGMLLGITTFASLVQSYCEIGEDAEAVLNEIEEKTVRLGDRDVGEDAKATVGHPGLFAAINESLTFLDERKGCHVKSVPLLSTCGEGKSCCSVFSASYAPFSAKAFSSRYTALHMLQASSVAISFPLLCHLWHVATVGEVKKIVRRFVDIGLARLEGEEEKYFVLHDLQYEFCSLSRDSLYRGPWAGDASETCDPVNGHALFLSSCKSLLLPKCKEDEFSWAQFCFGDSASSDSTLREYLQQNLVWHLCFAEPDQGFAGPEKCSPSVHVLSVLCDFWWLLGRLKSKWGRSSLMRDFHHVLESSILSENDAFFVHKLRETLMQVRQEDLVQSDGTLASSLVQLALSVEAESSVFSVSLFTQVSENAKAKVLGAWLKPVSGCDLSLESNILKKASISSAGIHSFSPLGDGKHFVSLSGNGAVRIHGYSNMDAVLILERLGKVSSISVAQKGETESSPRIFSEDADGVLCYSDITLNEGCVSSDAKGGLEESNRVLFGKSDSTWSCLSASKDGKVVAVAFGDGIVSVWELDDDSAGNYVRSNNFNCSFDEGEGCRVKVLVVSESGGFVAACSSDGDLVFWRKESGKERRVARLAGLASDDDDFRVQYIFVSSDEADLVVLFDGSPACEVWDTKAGERRFPRVELPDFDWISCGMLAGSSDGSENVLSLVVGGCQSGAYILVEYSIGDELERVGTCRLLVGPYSICSADFKEETGQSHLIVGGLDGSVRLLGADALDASEKLEHRESGVGAEDMFGENRCRELGNIYAVAVMSEGGLVVAGHEDGRLSLWWLKDGTFVRVIGSGKEVGSVHCIDISADESVAVTGYTNGSASVWETSTWTVRCALESECHCVVCVAVLPDANRVFTVDLDGECRVWDAERGGAALGVIETGLEYDPRRSRGCVSSDGRHFIWTTGGPDWVVFGPDDRWKGKVIDNGGYGEGRIDFESDEHRQRDALLCAEADSGTAHTEAAIGSWKEAAVYGNSRCELPELEKESGSRWQISVNQSSNVRCALKLAGGELVGNASIDLGSQVCSIAAQWLPYPGEDGRRRAVVSCALRGKGVPVILHFITSKV